jgi:hypothetical protein
MADITPSPTVSNSLTLADLADDRRWLTWRITRRDGKPSKTPFDPSDRSDPRRNRPRLGNTADWRTWATRDEALARWQQLDEAGIGEGGGVGIVLGRIDEALFMMGVDLDSCFDADNVLTPWASEIVDRLSTYCEISPSGRGVKAFFLAYIGELNAIRELFGKNGEGKWLARRQFAVDQHLEIAVDCGRYYAVTDVLFDGCPPTLRTVPLEDIKWLIEEAGPRFLQMHGRPPRNGRRQNGGDNSGSGYGFRYMRERKQAGDTFEQACAAILGDTGPAGEWARRVDDRQLRRAFDNNNSNTARQDGDQRTLTARALSEFEPRETEWLWWPWVVRRGINCLYGDGGVGKSTVFGDLAARVSVDGAELPAFGDGLRHRSRGGKVLIMTHEDDPYSVLRGRIAAAGGDLDKCYFVGFPAEDATNEFDAVDRLDTRLKELEGVVRELGNVDLIVIDPLADFTGEVNYNSSPIMRGKVLQPLNALARRLDLAIIYTGHMNKKNDLNARQRLTGCDAVLNFPRSTLFVGLDPDDQERRVMVQEKKNLTHGYYSAGFRLPHSTTASRVRIEWEQEWANMTADELLKKRDDGPAKEAKAKQLLNDMLGEGPARSTDIEAAAQRADISHRTLLRARKEMGIRAHREGDVWWLRMPDRKHQ